MEPLFSLFRPSGGVLTLDQLSYFGSTIRQPDQAGAQWVYLAAYYMIVVGLGLASFLLNRRRFSLGRFLTYAVMALLWGVYIRFGTEFAIVFIPVVALNGQEWYHDRFGTEGRLGRGWALWSVGGRAVTIILIFACVAKGLTGWRAQPGEAQFGFGFRPDEFSFEAAEYLKTAPIRGNILNTSLQQGDSLIWRAYPLRKTFIDGRHHLFSPATRLQLEETRLALRDDAVETLEADPRPVRDQRGDDRGVVGAEHLPAPDAEPELDPLLRRRRRGPVRPRRRAGGRPRLLQGAAARCRGDRLRAGEALPLLRPRPDAGRLDG